MFILVQEDKQHTKTLMWLFDLVNGKGEIFLLLRTQFYWETNFLLGNFSFTYCSDEYFWKIHFLGFAYPPTPPIDMKMEVSNSSSSTSASLLSSHVTSGHHDGLSDYHHHHHLPPPPPATPMTSSDGYNLATSSSASPPPTMSRWAKNKKKFHSKKSETILDYLDDV